MSDFCDLYQPVYGVDDETVLENNAIWFELCHEV